MRYLFLFGGLVFFCSLLVAVEPISETTTTTTTAATAAETSDAEADDATSSSKKKGPWKKRPQQQFKNRLKSPDAIIGTTEPERPLGADTILGGTVPALWELEPSHLEDDDLSELMERETIAPPVPGKVVRYAMHLLAHYDANGDGVLQREEWMKMPGTPQAIDLDGDGNITLDELVRYLAVYGAKRTIHRPNPIETFYQPKIVSSQLQLFRPLSSPPPKQETAEKKETPPAEDMTEAAVAADEETDDEKNIDDTTYEDIVSGTMAPTEKKYYTQPEALRGVPLWFLRLDRDGDGQVSLVEFAPNMSPASLALFGRLDKNGDGFITPDEVRKEEPPKKEKEVELHEPTPTARPVEPPGSGGVPPTPGAH